MDVSCAGTHSKFEPVPPAAKLAPSTVIVVDAMLFEPEFHVSSFEVNALDAPLMSTLDEVNPFVARFW